jgi:hypothetical protein
MFIFTGTKMANQYLLREGDRKVIRTRDKHRHRSWQSSGRTRGPIISVRSGSIYMNPSTRCGVRRIMYRADNTLYIWMGRKDGP